MSQVDPVQLKAVMEEAVQKAKRRWEGEAALSLNALRLENQLLKAAVAGLRSPSETYAVPQTADLTTGTVPGDQPETRALHVAAALRLQLSRDRPAACVPAELPAGETDPTTTTLIAISVLCEPTRKLQDVEHELIAASVARLAASAPHAQQALRVLVAAAVASKQSETCARITQIVSTTPWDISAILSVVPAALQAAAAQTCEVAAASGEEQSWSAYSRLGDVLWLCNTLLQRALALARADPGDAGSGATSAAAHLHSAVGALNELQAAGASVRRRFPLVARSVEDLRLMLASLVQQWHDGDETMM
ncbi:unnamed protein product [Pedinophyceae sp. YPF-701]|nr:unnamed protein product [Pedinophyceae sp. YPF-701]